MSKIAVLMPVRNGERFLKEAIESILNQTFGNFVFLLCDDNSDDDSRGVINGLRKKDNRIYFWIETETKGISETINFLLNHVKDYKCKYINVVDQDDISHPQKFEKTYKFMEQNPDYGLVGSKYSIIDEQSKLLQKNLMATNCVMHRKSCLDTAGYFNEDLSVLMDWELWLRMSEHYELVHVDEITCEVFIRNDKSNMSSNRIAMIATYHNIRDKFLKKMEKTHKNDYRLNTALAAFDEYDSADTFLRNHFEAIKKKGVKRAAIFGSSCSGKLYLNYLTNAGVEVPVIFDNDIEKQGEKLNGVLIQDPESVNDYDLDAVVIASRGHKREIIKQIKSIADNDLMIINK